MCASTAVKIGKLLQRTGYIHQVIKDGSVVFANGPTGALLRQNVYRTWWERMVIKSDSAFPVYGQHIDPVQFYPDILKLQNQNVPFSIVHTKQQPAQNFNEGNELKEFLNSEEETCLNFNHFCQPSAVNQMYDQVANSRINWWKQYSCNASNFTVKTTTDANTRPVLLIQYKFPWGPPVTIETVCNTGDEKIKLIEQESAKKCRFYNGKKGVFPSLIECHTTIEMAMAVFLNDAYSTSNLDKEVLQLHPALAPFKVAILRDGENRRQIHEVAMYIGRELRKGGLQIIDTKDPAEQENGRSDQQLMRYDEIGIPFTVIVDNYTLETGAIKLRNRDTTVQETLAINRLLEHVSKHVTYEPSG